MSRVKKEAGTVVHVADVASIAYRVIDVNTAGATPSTGSLSAAAVIYNTLQTSALDTRWPANAPTDGYNFGGSIPGSVFTLADTRYYVRIDATMGDGTTVTLYQGFHTTDEAY